MAIFNPKKGEIQTMLTEKIKELRSQINEKRADMNAKIDEAQAKAAEGDLQGAKDIKAQIDALKAEIEDLQQKLKDLEELAGLQKEDVPQAQDGSQDAPQAEEKSNKEGETRSMAKERKILNPAKEEVRAFEQYIRTKGREVRDLDTTNTSVVIPEEVVNDILELKQESYDLSQYVTLKKVGTKSGSFPVAKRNTAILATKDELAEIADVTEDMFINVDWDVQTRAGKIALSNELVEDSAIDIVAEVKKQLQRMVVGTNNQNIINLLKGFTKVTGTSVDDIKKVFNVDLDPALNKSVIVNQSMLNYLDTLKDAQGRYLLQPDLQAPSGKSLFGAPVIVVSDALLPNEGTQSSPQFPMIIGDLEEAVGVFVRNQVTAEWQKFDYYSEGLSIIVRNDYKVIDPNAARYVVINPSTGA